VGGGQPLAPNRERSAASHPLLSNVAVGAVSPGPRGREWRSAPTHPPPGRVPPGPALGHGEALSSSCSEQFLPSAASPSRSSAVRLVTTGRHGCVGGRQRRGPSTSRRAARVNGFDAVFACQGGGARGRGEPSRSGSSAANQQDRPRSGAATAAMSKRGQGGQVPGEPHGEHHGREPGILAIVPTQSAHAHHPEQILPKEVASAAVETRRRRARRGPLPNPSRSGANEPPLRCPDPSPQSPRIIASRQQPTTSVVAQRAAPARRSWGWNVRKVTLTPRARAVYLSRPQPDLTRPLSPSPATTIQ